MKHKNIWKTPTIPEVDRVASSGFSDTFRTKREPTQLQLIKKYQEWVFTCSNINAQAVASAPYHLYAKKSVATRKNRFPTIDVSVEQCKWLMGNKFISSRFGGAELVELTEHPALDLLNKVNDIIDGFELFELTDLYQELVGSAYWYIPNNLLGVPEAIWIIPAHLIKTIQDRETGLVIRYELHSGLGKKDYDPKDIIAFHFPSLEAPYLSGLSPTRACIQSLGLLESDVSTQQASLNNRSRPDMLVSPKDTISDVEAERLVKRIQKQLARGGAGGILVAESAMDYKALVFNAKEMEAVARHGINKTAVYNAFQVPIALGEGGSVNRSTLEAALFQHSKLAVVPRLTRLFQKLNQSYITRWDENLILWFDNPIPEDRKLTALERKVNIDTGVVVINEERNKQGLESVPWGAKPWLNANKIQPSDSPEDNQRQIVVQQNLEDDKDKDKDEDKPDIEKVYAVLASGVLQDLHRNIVIHRLSKLGVPLTKAFDWTEPFIPSNSSGMPSEKLYDPNWYKVKKGENRHLPKGTNIARVIIRLLKRQGKEVLEKIGKTIKTIDLTTPISFEHWDKQFADDAHKPISFWYNEGGKDFVNRVGVGEFSVTNPAVQLAIETASLKFAKSTNKKTSLRWNTARKKIREALQANLITSQDIPSELVKAVHEIFNLGAKSDAERIALTESSRALHEGQSIAARDSGVVKGFEWLLSSDPCSICLGIKARYPKGIKVDSDFGKVSDYSNSNPSSKYDEIPHPPAHPYCQCTMIEIIDIAAISNA